MRFLVMVKATERSEAGELPTDEQMAAMGAFNHAMMEAGVLEDGGGLQATSSGARIKFSNGEATVINGPFKGAKDLVAGFWIIEAESKDDAIVWMQRAPFGAFGHDAEIEIRKILGPEDFELDPEQ